jgi:hypothetical protein
MTEYLVEVYLSRSGGVEASAARARQAAEQLTREGTPVLYLSSIFVPADETCFFLYQAASAEAVHEAARRASLAFERVSEAVAESKGAPR